MRPVSEFVMDLHRKYGKNAGPNYEEREFESILDEMLTINLARTKEERIHFPRSEISSLDDMTNGQLEFFNKVKNRRQKDIESTWKSQIEAWLEYRKPFLIDAQ